MLLQQMAVVADALVQDAALNQDCHHQDFVYIVASAVNQDGCSSSFMAPNGPSQQQVVQT